MAIAVEIEAFSSQEETLARTKGIYRIDLKREWFNKGWDWTYQSRECSMFSFNDQRNMPWMWPIIYNRRWIRKALERLQNWKRENERNIRKDSCRIRIKVCQTSKIFNLLHLWKAVWIHKSKDTPQNLQESMGNWAVQTSWKWEETMSRASLRNWKDP